MQPLGKGQLSPREADFVKPVRGIQFGECDTSGGPVCGLNIKGSCVPEGAFSVLGWSPLIQWDKRREGAAHNARIDFSAGIAAPALNKAIEPTEFNSR